MASASILPFLLPSPLPRPSSLRFLFQRQISSQSHRLRSKPPASVSSRTAVPSSPPAASQPSAYASSVTSPLSYHVHRTASQELPIYHLAKRGGNLHQTRIRKIEGDVEKLRDEIVQSLGIREDLAVINRLTGHIVIKGWYRDDVKRFLEERHF